MSQEIIVMLSQLGKADYNKDMTILNLQGTTLNLYKGQLPSSSNMTLVYTLVLRLEFLNLRVNIFVNQWHNSTTQLKEVVK